MSKIDNLFDPKYYRGAAVSCTKHNHHNEDFQGDPEISKLVHHLIDKLKLTLNAVQTGIYDGERVHADLQALKPDIDAVCDMLNVEFVSQVPDSDIPPPPPEDDHDHDRPHGPLDDPEFPNPDDPD